MTLTYWHKQTTDKPLYPELLWSRPENQRSAGKLLIMGGNLHGFAAPAEAYAQSVKAGIGTVRVLLPDAIRKHFAAFQGTSLETEFAPSTPSGSFSQKALAELLEHSNWADVTLIAGDLGRNSEAAILLEKFFQKSKGRIALSKEAVDYAIGVPNIILKRPDTLLVLTMSQLQKVATQLQSLTPIKFGMDLLKLIETLHELTLNHSIAIVVWHLEQLFCAVGGQVSTTVLTSDEETWRIKTAAYASVWWLQNPQKPFEALTTAIYDSGTL